jgi:hypothetical protein
LYEGDDLEEEGAPVSTPCQGVQAEDRVLSILQAKLFGKYHACVLHHQSAEIEADDQGLGGG